MRMRLLARVAYAHPIRVLRLLCTGPRRAAGGPDPCLRGNIRAWLTAMPPDALLLNAAALTRADHGEDHPRAQMWDAMADLMYKFARLAPYRGSNDPLTLAANKVAREYIEAR